MEKIQQRRNIAFFTHLKNASPNFFLRYEIESVIARLSQKGCS